MLISENRRPTPVRYWGTGISSEIKDTVSLPSAAVDSCMVSYSFVFLYHTLQNKPAFLTKNFPLSTTILYKMQPAICNRQS
jgi:hypothetical protein